MFATWNLFGKLLSKFTFRLYRMKRRRRKRFDEGVGKADVVRIRKLMEDIEIIRRVAVTKKM